MANSSLHGDQAEEPNEEKPNYRAGYAGCDSASSDLPQSIKAIQERFRPRFEAQDRRMEALAAAQFVARLANATVTHDLPADEALRLLEQLANGEIDWPVW